MAEESLQTTVPVKEHVRANPSPLIAKITEVILAIFIIGLIVDPLNSYHRIMNLPYRYNKLDDVAVIYISVAGYLLINVVFLISRALGDKVPKRTLIMFSSLGSLMHIVAASLMVHKWRLSMGGTMSLQNNAIRSSKQYNDMLISGAVFTYLNAVVFVLEVVLTIRLSN